MEINLRQKKTFIKEGLRRAGAPLELHQLLAYFFPPSVLDASPVPTFVMSQFSLLLCTANLYWPQMAPNYYRGVPTSDGFHPLQAVTCGFRNRLLKPGCLGPPLGPPAKMGPDPPSPWRLPLPCEVTGPSSGPRGPWWWNMGRPGL